MSERIRTYTTTSSDEGTRLDRFLTVALEIPRNQVKRLISEGRVEIDGRDAKASTSLRPGTTITAALPEARDPEIQPERGPLEVLYQDEHLVVIDKPPGLAVHPGAGRESGTLAHRLLDRFPEIAPLGGPGRPGIVHRLDLDTSGVLAIARSERAFQSLSRAFAERRVDKLYSAIVYGRPQPGIRRIDQPIGRHPRDRTKMAIRPDGRRALSTFECLAFGTGLSWLAVRIETGRTHQIRVHLKSIGHPIVGDPKYGEARWQAQPARHRRRLRTFSRPALHATSLRFDHPATGEEISCTAPIPTDMIELWTAVTDSPPPV